MRVLVSGGAGYVGSALCLGLLERGHQVRIVDIGLFGTDHLPAEAELIVENILDCRREWLRDIDAVINLAGLSNDPMANFSPRLNYEQNSAGAALLAQAARDAGVPRFVQGSTCSVYGFTDGQEVDEDHTPRPSFPYAISKLMAERALWCLESKEFRPIILRKATVIGWSPRMRYDLVVNTMVKSALTTGRITVHNPGVWRPIIDIEDAVTAYLLAVEAPLDFSGVLNISAGNFTVGRIARLVAGALAERGLEVPIVVEHREDPRNYRVKTARAREILGFQPSVSIHESALRLLDRISEGKNSDLENPLYVNIEWITRRARALQVVS